MIRRLPPYLALAAALACAAPALAQTALIIPPYDPAGPSAKIATDDQALAAMRAHGVTQVQRLGLVGDYWEGEGLLDGRYVVAYIFDNGAFEARPTVPGEHVPVPIQSAQTPR